MVLEVPSTKNRMFWAFQKSIIQLFSNFWVMKLKAFSGKVKQNVQNYLNQNLVIGSFLENGFEATLISKTNVLSVWKKDFQFFCKFLSNEVETIFWESEAKYRNQFFQNLVVRSFLENAFQATLISKTNILRV